MTSTVDNTVRDSQIYSHAQEFLHLSLSLSDSTAYLSPRAPRAERVRAASEQTFSIGKQYLDIIATIFHALPLVLAGIGLVFGRWPRGVFEG